MKHSRYSLSYGLDQDAPMSMVFEAKDREEAMETARKFVLDGCSTWARINFFNPTALYVVDSDGKGELIEDRII